MDVSSLMEEIKSECLPGERSRRALLVLDYKMKFERMHHREKTVDHYGKKGISWHGAMAMQFSLQKGGEEPTLQRVCFDDISFADAP